MNSREILAFNVRRLIDASTPSGARPSVRAWALGKGLNVRMIDRFVKGQHAITLDKLEEIAAACGVKSWQLLLEDFDPVKPPLPPVSEDDLLVLRRLRRLLDDNP